MKKISVIMSIYNEKKEWLQESIESILNQTYSNLQFVIVLDNPDNNMARGMVEDYLKKDCRITFVENDNNIGLVASLNKALGYADGEFIARMDADDISMKDRFDKEIEILGKENVDIVTSDIDLLYDEDNKIVHKKVGTFSNEGFNKVVRYGNLSTHPTWLVRRKVYDVLDGYRELKYCEDYDFILRAIQSGFKCYRIGESLLKYRIRSSGISQTFSTEQDIKARYLRKAMRENKVISEIDINCLNEKAKIQAKDEKCIEAVKLIEKCSKLIAGRNYLKGLLIIFREFVANTYFRLFFFETSVCYLLQKKYRIKENN